jgi:hypothetical protein
MDSFFKPSREVYLAAVGGFVAGGVIVALGMGVYIAKNKNPNPIPQEERQHIQPSLKKTVRKQEKADLKDFLLKNEILEERCILKSNGKQKINYSGMRNLCDSVIKIHGLLKCTT